MRGRGLYILQKSIFLSALLAHLKRVKIEWGKREREEKEREAGVEGKKMKGITIIDNGDTY